MLADAGLAKLRAIDPASLPAVEGNPRFGACVGGIGKFMCIGLNYSDHAAESGLAVPEASDAVHEGDLCRRRTQ